MNTFRKIANMHRWEKGASPVELAIVAPILFFLLFVIIEMGILFWVNLTMQYAVREGARYSITGQNNRDPNPNENARERYLGVIQTIKNGSLGLFDATNAKIVVLRAGNAQTYDQLAPDENIFGGPSEIVVIQLNCTWNLITPFWRLVSNTNFFPNGKYNFTVAATMRNEAF